MATKNNSRTRRNKRRAAARLGKAAERFVSINPIESFKGGNPKTAYEAVDALKKARALPSQVQRDASKEGLLASIGGAVSDEESDERSQKIEQANQLRTDLANAFHDARGDEPMTAKHAAVLFHLYESSVPNDIKDALMNS